MRLGKRPNTQKTHSQHAAKKQRKGNSSTKSKNKATEKIVGQISPDLISTIFAPLIKQRATEALEKYANDWMLYEEQLAALAAQQTTLSKQENGESTETSIIDHDGTVQQVHTNSTTTATTIPPMKPVAPLFRSQFLIDDFTQIMDDTSDHFFTKTGGWRVHANAARFERVLDEKYGIFRPFVVNHPEVEHFIRAVQRKYAMGYFSPFRQSGPPIPRSTSVILLFMMQRGKVTWDILILASLFLLVGLQPWALVAIIAGTQLVIRQQKRRPISLMSTKIRSIDPYYHSNPPTDSNNDSTTVDTTTTAPETGGVQSHKDPNNEYAKQKNDWLRTPVGTPLRAGETTIDTTNFDTLIVGSGPNTLYTAALLSRAGRKVLILSSRSDASGCLMLEGSTDPSLREIPFDIDNCSVAKISRQQEILAPALCTKTDCQGGIRFAQIGSAADGYAFEILSIPGVGADRRDHEIPFVLRASDGLNGLMDETATKLGDGWPGSDGEVGHSMAGAYVKACETINATASWYFSSKMLPEYVERFRAPASYQEISMRYAESFLNKCFPLNAHVRSLMAGLGLKGENLRPCLASMSAHITNVCASLSGEGMHYPIGGPRALCHALANVVLQGGGRIISGCTVTELVLVAPTGGPSVDSAPEDSKGTKGKALSPLCVGVKLDSGVEVRFDIERYKERASDPVVVSMEPFIQTCLRWLPTEIRTAFPLARGLPALSEQRPVFKILCAFQGNAEDLSITGADYYRLPSAALATDEMDQESGAIKYGEIGWPDEDEREKTATVALTCDGDETTDQPHRQQSKKKKTKRFEPGVSWMQICFPSAKDPSFEHRHGKVTTCVVTIEADDDFVTDMGTQPRLFVVKKASTGFIEEVKRLLQRVVKDVFQIFPQLEGKLLSSVAHGPYIRGMSHTPERFVAKGVRTDTPYRGLYFGGPDLTVGESFSGSIVAGWLVANAVARYSPWDHLLLQKTITSDLGQFLEPPETTEEEDVAVPFQSQLDAVVPEAE